MAQMDKNIGAHTCHDLEVEPVVTSGVGCLGQARQIFADSCKVRVRCDQCCKALRHAEDVQRTRKDGQPHGWIARFQPLHRLNRDKHAFRHKPLGQFAPATGQSDILAKLNDGTMALRRQSAGGSR